MHIAGEVQQMALTLDSLCKYLFHSIYILSSSNRSIASKFDTEVLRSIQKDEQVILDPLAAVVSIIDLSPIPPASIFTGREDALKQLEAYFAMSESVDLTTKRNVSVLYGLGGSGKTQIARKFIANHTSRYFDILGIIPVHSYPF